LSRREVLWHLAVQSERIDGVALLRVVGRISHATVPLLATPVEAAAGGGDHVVLDLTGVDYLNSAGLQVIEAAAARLAGSDRALIVCGVQDAVRPALDLAGPIPHLRLEATVADALAHASSVSAPPEPPDPVRGV